MNRPHHYLLKMSIFLLATTIVCSILFLPFKLAFMSNAALNGLIVGVLLLGISYNVRQVIGLYPEVKWIESFKAQLESDSPDSQVLSLRSPKLLAPMATMVSARKRNFTLSTLAMSALLDGIASRLDESRDTSRYTIGLLIFLGLLGTFWGLLDTVNSISTVISSLDVNGNEPSIVFNELKSGLQMPLDGMGTAFSSSLFGLAGSLVLGFLDLQANQAQNRFYNELEEWLSSKTQLTSSNILDGNEQSVPVYVHALLEQTVESIDKLRITVTSSEASRETSDKFLIKLQDGISTLNEQTKTEQDLMINSLSSTDFDPCMLKGSL